MPGFTIQQCDGVMNGGFETTSCFFSVLMFAGDLAQGTG